MAGEQSALWNGPGGRAWVALHEMLDGMLLRFEELLVDAVVAERAARVLDVGCGTGATSLAIARRAGACTGVDVSETMLALARARAEKQDARPVFVLADAQTHPFEPSSFDMIVSRFGVMFFEDPAAAFANLRRAAKSAGALRFFAWRSPAENTFMTTPERAVAPLVPPMPPRDPDAPGMFAFADDVRVRRILGESGWSAIDVRAIDVPCTLPERDLARYLGRMGSVGRMLEHADDALRTRVVAAARAALEPWVHGDEVRFTSACWSVSARA